MKTKKKEEIALIFARQPLLPLSSSRFPLLRLSCRRFCVVVPVSLLASCLLFPCPFRLPSFHSQSRRLEAVDPLSTATQWSRRPSRGRSRRSRRRSFSRRHPLRRRRLRLRRRASLSSRSPAASLPGVVPSPLSRRVRARPRRPLPRERAAACSEEEAGGPRPRGRSRKHPRGRLPLSLPTSDRPPSPRPPSLRRTLRPT